MILFYDTETTGLPNFRAAFNHESQPHLVSLCCILTEDDGRDRSLVNLIVNPGVPSDPKALEAHKLDEETTKRCGVSEQVAVAMWSRLASIADLIVAHNINFDDTVMACAWARTGGDRQTMEAAHGKTKRFCTMEAASPIINLPPTERMIKAGINKPKAPRLEECIEHFFGNALNGHDALVDASACSRLYFHLKSIGAAA